MRDPAHNDTLPRTHSQVAPYPPYLYLLNVFLPRPHFLSLPFGSDQGRGRTDNISIHTLTAAYPLAFFVFFRFILSSFGYSVSTSQIVDLTG